MADAHAKPNHDYHLVDPSPWPIISAFLAGVLALWTIAVMRTNSAIDQLLTNNPDAEITYDALANSLFFGLQAPIWSIVIPLVLLIVVIGAWWADVVKEAQVDKAHTPVVQLGLRYGMLLFIASEVLFFVAFFWAYFHASFTTDLLNGITTFNPIDIPLYNTVILLLSGTTVTWAHEALREGKRSEFMIGLGITVALGLLFTAVQGFEYAAASFEFGAADEVTALGDAELARTLYTNYGGVFFAATGFHGAHVIIGTLFLAVAWYRGWRGDFTPNQHFGFEAAAWYWHFVDVVWLFLYVAIYWNIFQA